MKKVSLLIIAVAVMAIVQVTECMEERAPKGAAVKAKREGLKEGLKRHGRDVREAWRGGRQAPKGRGLKEGWGKYKAI